jgi:ADP-heptose:LPS heptosyltransferase/ubiquinone/menaquinone biosynthesis C-methylase UbiE
MAQQLKIGLGEILVTAFRRLRNRYLPLGTNRRAGCEWFINQIKNLIGVPPHQALGNFMLSRYRQIKDVLLPLGTWRRRFYQKCLIIAKRLIFFTPSLTGLFKTGIKNYDEIAEYLSDRSRDKILISYQGGMGDTLLLYWLTNTAKRKFPNSYLFLLPSRRNVATLKGLTHFMVNTFILDMYDDGHKNALLEAVENLRLCDLIFDIRYATKVIAPTGKYKQFAEALFPEFCKNNINFDTFPLANNLIGQFGIRLFDIITKTSGLSIQPWDITFPLSPEDFSHLGKLPGRPYVTINNGTDSGMVMRGSGSTKQWPVAYWQELVRRINSLGISVVQLGTSCEAPVKGAVNLLGETTLGQAAAIIKGALCNISLEGGLVWLAKAVGKRSVVLFGPTDVNFFGQPENLNLSANLPCAPCWWTIKDWFVKCPRGYARAKCMESISVQMVVEKITPFLEKTRRDSSNGKPIELYDVSLFSEKLIAENEAILKRLYEAAGLEYTGLYKNRINKINGLYIHGSKNWEYLYGIQKVKNFMPTSSNDRISVLDAGSGRGAIHKLLLADGYKVTLADINYTHGGLEGESKFLSQCDPSLTIAFNSIFNLSFPDNSFDVVFCFSVLEHVKNKPFVLKELLRVLKNDGLLSITFDFTSENMWLNDVTDLFGKKYRIEVFNEKNLISFVNGLLRKCDISKELLLNKYESSSTEIQRVGIEGIPPGMTVGGITIRKR